MKLFSCQTCAQILYFENTRCERCLRALGYWPDDNVLSALEPDGDAFRALGVGGRLFRMCANAKHGVCNWLVPSDSCDTFCAACSHNLIIPDQSDFNNRVAWKRLEAAKHRHFYTLFRLNLAQTQNMRFAQEPLRFLFLDDVPNMHQVMTGHANGVITIAVPEADDAERELRRKAMGEPYRTLLGHFRHETGHYVWDRLVRDANRLDEFRAVFGDERIDYQIALAKHYRDGPPWDWQERYVSSYAACHPWEDFAETWAHYLHIVDTLELVESFGLQLEPKVDRDKEFRIEPRINPYRAESIKTMIHMWIPVTSALNAFNKTLGRDDLYPFTLAPAVITKIDFIHKLIHSSVGYEAANEEAGLRMSFNQAT